MQIAPTAFGKAVLGAWLSTRRRASTPVPVHTRPLMDQWIRRMGEFLDMLPGGQTGVGRKRITELD